ncbi:hypothetical protein BZG36_03145 [Bifiguratus adelaidae]|uniref:Uncharacterized protein n=1 Tax=Bifiguratus adelaidae TaxID=1938954 RepID=A0A261XX86_9FUNG|nr:hypothetical protein BZG36_03145 [Bifiguratus adelaidae]
MRILLLLILLPLALAQNLSDASITSPQAGSFYQPGQTVNIAYNLSNINAIQKVTLAFWNNAPTSSSTTNAGYYQDSIDNSASIDTSSQESWTIPSNIANGQYWIVLSVTYRSSGTPTLVTAQPINVGGVSALSRASRGVVKTLIGRMMLLLVALLLLQ